MHRLLIVVALVACAKPAPRPAPATDEEAPAGGTATRSSTSTSTATQTTPETTTTTTTTATSTTTTTAPAGPRELASCPATYAEAAAGTCALASVGKLSCTYADGGCSCAEARPCSGLAMAYEEARKHPRPAWSCTPKVRPDGCLGDPPAIGSACAKDAQECSYGSCGGHVLGCRGGTWEITRQIAPPPAAHH